ncbi:replication terminator protein [Paenisporosarcina cavernae]|uniref:Replication terminator protein n=1 Tax=Paenisporosarcina cavernae TaxID=2320858 RepID=A0A385YTL7_9BACL|nr:replication terminator protein [Paenisporosarcina cavernae]AYC29660.1 replication terminator protein [Paenisporosarcina cavernae]AYC30021.1 replication terminator protein [Paenisporosarcina cavernae]
MSNHVNLETFANGALAERINLELSKVLENIADPNTDPKKARKVTMNITLKPNESRNLASVSITAKCNLQPAREIETNLMIDYNSEGKVVGAELKSGIPGQMYVDENGEVLTDRGEKPAETEIAKKENKVVNFK